MHTHMYEYIPNSSWRTTDVHIEQSLHNGLFSISAQEASRSVDCRQSGIWMRHMNESYEWGIWMSHMNRHMNESYEWVIGLWIVDNLAVTWRLYMCDMTKKLLGLWIDNLRTQILIKRVMLPMWISHVTHIKASCHCKTTVDCRQSCSDMTPLYVWHDSFTYVTWLFCTCDMAHSCGSHDNKATHCNIYTCATVSTLFGLTCTIRAQLTYFPICTTNEWAGVDIRWFPVDRFDTRWIPRSFSCSVRLISIHWSLLGNDWSIYQLIKSLHIRLFATFDPFSM